MGTWLTGTLKVTGSKNFSQGEGKATELVTSDFNQKLKEKLEQYFPNASIMVDVSHSLEPSKYLMIDHPLQRDQTFASLDLAVDKLEVEAYQEALRT
ncbi:hypothetical protein [Deinococcus roseus]|uniref:Uncharacterized protein n=1 Tax=Deinococcus roseus TaxID=392414 RepID=A0ABQ2D6P3_9DEIO|nr:hypothetical protein [Deinococcus roseus]GGJ47912.1 hypothetical protein GCM10008938_37390 [Deinococcus roseus]